MVQLHQIKPESKRKTKKRVGRGGKRGTYCGRGLKGQKSRAGRKTRPALRDIIKRIPKKRGYRFKSIKKQSTKK
jgi:large subunit ribosomal protein L15